MFHPAPWLYSGSLITSNITSKIIAATLIMGSDYITHETEVSI